MAVKKRTGLGRGLDALISDQAPLRKKDSTKPASAADPAEAKTAKKEKSSGKTEQKTAAKTASEQDGKNTRTETYVRITDVEPNRDQPRKKFDEDALMELSESIKQYGVLQPLLVQKKENYYEIIAGERRWRAAKMAGLKEVPVIIKELSSREMVEISLIENIQREDLNPIEEAEAYQRLLTDFHLKQDEVAERVSRSRTAVTNSIRLLKLDDRVRQMLIDEMITTGHARTLLSIENKDVQYKLAQKIFDEKISVREAERLSKIWQKGEPVPKTKEEPDPRMELLYRNFEDKMRAALGSKVVIRHGKDQKGKIEIDYHSHDELERLLYLFQTNTGQG